VEQVSQEVTPKFPFRVPTSGEEPECGLTSDDDKQDGELDLEVPDPDLPNFENKNEAELEEEIAMLSQEHLRNLDEIGFRVYWLNEKYKERGQKKAGEGVKALCERIDFDLNHWNYLVSKYRLIIYKCQPESLNAEQVAKAEQAAVSKAAKKGKKKKATLFDPTPQETASQPKPIIEKIQLSDQPPDLAVDVELSQVHEVVLPIFPTFDDVTEMIKRHLVTSPASRQLEDLEKLIDWIERKINAIRLTLEEAA
jgi:hypothetical protein